MSNNNPNPKAYLRWDNSDIAADFLQISNPSNQGGSVLGWIDENGELQGSLAVGGFGTVFSSSEVINVTGNTGALANTPTGTFLMLTKNGQVLINGVDYTIAGNVITYTISALGSDIFGAWYSYQ